MLALAALIAGAAIGMMSWLAGILPLSALLFIAAPLAAGRGRAYATALGYYLAASIGIIQGTGNFFGTASSVELGLAFWLGTSAALALPWALLDLTRRGIALNANTSRARLILTAAVLGIIEIILCAPPLMLFGWANPAFGLFAIGPWQLVVPLLAGGALLLSELSDAPEWSAYAQPVAALMIATLTAIYVLYPRPTALPGWHAIDTHYGRQDTTLQGITRSYALASRVLDKLKSGAHVVVTPEAVAGVWYAGTAAIWRPVIEYTAQHPGDTVLVGTSITAGRGLVDGIMQISAGRTRFREDALPVPYSMWHPWRPYHSYRLSPLHRETMRVDGKRASYQVCYEQLMLLSALQTIAERPQVLVGVANDWWSPALVRRQQSIALHALGRFLSIPVVDASNR